MGADGKGSLHHPSATATVGLSSYGPSLLLLLLSAQSGHSKHTAHTALRTSCDPETGKTANWEKRCSAALLISSALGKGAVVLLVLPGELGKAPVELSDSYTRHTGFKAHR